MSGLIFVFFSLYRCFKIGGILDHHHHEPTRKCSTNDDCPVIGTKLLRVLKMNARTSGSSAMKELDFKGGWCDVCLQMAPISNVLFTCRNEKCDLHVLPYPYSICGICENEGMAKCMGSMPCDAWEFVQA